MAENKEGGGLLRSIFFTVVAYSVVHVSAVALGFAPILTDLGTGLGEAFNSQAAAQTPSSGGIVHTPLSESFSVNDCLAGGGRPEMFPDGPLCHIDNR